MSQPRVRPFPWRALDSVTRSEAAALGHVERVVAAYVRRDRLAGALRDLLAVDAELVVGKVSSGALPPFGDGVALLVARPGDDGGKQAVLLQAEGALAANVASRALRRAPGALFDPQASPSSPLVAGAFAAVVVAAARRAHAGVALRILAAGTASALEADRSQRIGIGAGGGARDQAVWAHLTVLVDRDAFAARVVVPRDLAAVAFGAAEGAGAPWDIASLEGLGALPLSVPIVVGVAFLSVAEIATLRVGDALLVRPESELGTPSTRATFSGRVLLAAPTATAGVRAEIGEDGTLRALAAVGALTPVEAPMDPEDKDALLTTIGDVPVLVRVEIGEATMPARDWASLARGDVVPLGRRVGGAVILRVGGLPLARGELVDVEGEVGVRIVERMGGGEGTP